MLKSSGGEIDVFLLENKDAWRGSPNPAAAAAAAAAGTDLLYPAQPDPMLTFNGVDNPMTLVVPAGTANTDYFLGNFAQDEGVSDFFDEAGIAPFASDISEHSLASD